MSLEITVAQFNAYNFEDLNHYDLKNKKLSQDKIEQNLEFFVNWLNNSDIDILGLNEISLKQVKYISKNTNFENFIYSPNFKFWNIESGNATLSKYPILKKDIKNFGISSFSDYFISGFDLYFEKFIKLLQRKEKKINKSKEIIYPFLYYLGENFANLIGHRKYIHTLIDYKNTHLHIITSHLSASNHKKRAHQIEIILKYINRLILKKPRIVNFTKMKEYRKKKKQTLIILLMDLNTVYEDERKSFFDADYSKDRVLERIKKSDLFLTHSPIELIDSIDKEEGRNIKKVKPELYTYPSWNPERKIDYIIPSKNMEYKEMKTYYIQGSDHKLIKAKLLFTPSNIL